MSMALLGKHAHAHIPRSTWLSEETLTSCSKNTECVQRSWYLRHNVKVSSTASFQRLFRSALTTSGTKLLAHLISHYNPTDVLLQVWRRGLEHRRCTARLRSCDRPKPPRPAAMALCSCCPTATSICSHHHTPPATPCYPRPSPISTAASLPCSIITPHQPCLSRRPYHSR